MMPFNIELTDNPRQQYLNLQLSKPSADTSAHPKSKRQVDEWIRCIGVGTFSCGTGSFQPTLWQVLITPREVLFILEEHLIGHEHIHLQKEDCIMSITSSMGYFDDSHLSALDVLL